MCLDRYRQWKIALICCYINFLHFGIARLSSLLYLAALTRYNVNRSQASFPFILCYTVRNLSGPLVGYLGMKFQIHSVIKLGCILATIGIGGCFFAEDIYTVTVLWGVVYAFGFGMATVLIPEVLSRNFDEYLSNANGLAFSGECIAGFLLPPILQICLNTFGLSGTFLLLSGLILNSIPAALLLNPIHYPKKTNVNRKAIESLSGPEQPSEISQLLASVNGVSNEVFEPEESLVSTETKEPFVVKDSSNYINIHQTSQKAEQLAIQKEKSYSKNEISLKTNEIRSKSLDSNDFFVPTKAMHLAQEIPSHIINIQTVKERSHLSDELSKSTFGIQQNIPSHPNIEIKRKIILSSSETEESMISHSYPKINKKKCKHASLLKKEESIPLLLEEQSCSKHYESLDEENTRDQTPNFDLNKKFQSPTSLPPPSTPPLPKTSLFEPFRVFSDVTFLLILVTQSLLQYNCTLFLTIIVDLSRDDGLSSSQEIIVLVCMSIADLLGRIGLGWFTDLGFISNISFSAICCFTMSTAFGGLVFVKEFKLVCCLVFVFGLSLGGMLIVSPGVIYDYIEEDKRPMALAARFFLYALLSATQSPLIGYIRGKLGSYDWMLFILMILSLLSILTLVFTPLAARCRDKRKARKAEADENSNLIERVDTICETDDLIPTRK